MMYCIVALCGAMLFHAAGSMTYVHAETISSQTDYGLQARVDIDSKLIDRLDARQNSIDTHLSATDSKVGELSDRIAMMQGAGSAVMILLAILQMFGLITTAKANKAPTPH
jgi:hypothetical protein